MRNHNKAFPGIYLITAIMFPGSHAIAQERVGDAAVPQVMEKEDSLGIADIIVTATRRDSKLQSTPVAVSALGSELIQQARPKDLGEISAFVPNFSSARSISTAYTVSFAIRGVGFNSIVGTFEPPVVVLVDDFVFPSINSQLLDTFDISQIEVLRGPQGTLFGKNATGGAISVRTKRPLLDRAQAEFRGMAGSFGTMELHGAVDLPIVPETLGLRVVAAYRSTNGYVRNGFRYGPLNTTLANYAGVVGQGDGRKLGKEDSFSGRAKLLWEPSPGFTALLQYERVRDHSQSYGTTNQNVPGEPGYRWTLLGLGMGVPAGGDPLDFTGQTTRADAYMRADRPLLDVDGIYANIDISTGFGTLTSVTGYRDQFNRIPASSGGGDIVGRDGTLLTPYGINREEARETFSQELRFASDFKGPFGFVAGAFYQDDSIAYCQPTVQGYRDLLGATTPYGPWNQNPYIICNSQKAKSKAVFVEGTYEIIRDVKLTGGFRYTWDRKHWRGRQQAFVQDIVGDPSATWRDYEPLELGDFDRFPGSGYATAIEDSHSWSDPSYRAILSWQVTPTIYAYGSYSRGFKAGGYNQNGSGAPFGANLDAFRLASQPLDPEYANSYEMGAKTDLLDRRLRLNLTGFLVNYSDLQKQVVVPITNGVAVTPVVRYFNAAKARVKGVEAEVTALPLAGLTLRGVLGYMDAQYLSFVTPIPAGYDLTTSPLDRTPKWQWTTMANYVQPVGDLGELGFNVSVEYVGKNLHTQSISSPTANAFLKAQTLVNGSISFTGRDEKYFVRLIGRNLTNKRYNTAVQDAVPLWRSANFGPPRFFGIEVGVKH